MRYLPWLHIESTHPVFRSGSMDCLAFFPSENSQTWLRNHRCIWKMWQNRLTISIEEDPHNPGLPLILPSASAIELSIYIGINDLSYALYTEIDDSPIHYTQHHYYTDILGVESINQEILLNHSEIREKVKAIALPKPYQKMGVLHILIAKPQAFFSQIKNKVAHQIRFLCEEKKYQVCYVVKHSYPPEGMPVLVQEETEKVHFNELDVENDEYLFLISKEEVPLSGLADLSCFCIGTYNGEESARLKCKAQKFSLNDLTTHPTYPHKYILLREIKY